MCFHKNSDLGWLTTLKIFTTTSEPEQAWCQPLAMDPQAIISRSWIFPAKSVSRCLLVCSYPKKANVKLGKSIFFMPSLNRISISCNVENMRPPTFTILAGLGLALLRHPACPHGCNYPTTKNSQICHKIRFNPSPPRKKFPQRIKDNSGRRLLAHILREGGGLVTC